MVRIVSLRAENFRRLNFSEPLKFPSGLIVIRGSNEAGKSTIIEAVLFGLYGDFRIPSALRGGRQGLESLVNYRAGRARVEVVFEVGGKVYKVERVLEGDREGVRQIDARLVELTDGGARLLATGVTRVNEMVQKILRISWREMLATNVIAQKDLERVVRMDKTDRDKIINMMMGFESYNKALEKLGEESRERRRSLDEKRRDRDLIVNRVAELEEKGKKLDEWRVELMKVEAKIRHLEEAAVREEKAHKYLTELEDTMRLKNELKHSLEKTKEGITDAEAKLNKDKARLGELTTELSQLEREGQELAIKLSEAREEKSRIELELKRLSEIRDKVEELRAHRNSTLSALEEVRSRISSLNERLRKREDLIRERKSAERELNSLQKIEASVGLPAWSSTVALIVSLLSLLAALLLHPFLLAGLGLATLIVMLGLRSKYRRLQELAEKANRIRGQISRIDAELGALEREAAELEELNHKRVMLAKQLEEQDARLSSIAAKLQIESKPESIVKELLAKIDHVDKRREEALRRLNELERRLSQLDALVSEKKRERERLEREVEELCARLDKLSRQAESLEEEYRKLEIPAPPVEVEGLLWPIEESALKLVSELRRERAERYSRVREELGQARGQADELRKKIEEAEQELQQLPELKSRLEELAKEVERLELEVSAMDTAIDALKKVAERRRAAFAPSVENNMSWITSYITNGRYKAVRIDPQFYDVEVYDSEAGRWLRRDIYSGGTNDQFLLAMRIAFTLSLLPAAKGAYPRFLFLDEPLGSSDAERRTRIIGLLSKELNSVFDQVFLITHVDIEEPPGSTVIVMEEGKPERVYSLGTIESE